MLYLLPVSFAAMTLVFIAGATLTADDQTPIPATPRNPSTPRDSNLNPAHESARSQADQAYRQGDHKKAIEVASGILPQNPNDHVAYYLPDSARVELCIANRDATLAAAVQNDAALAAYDEVVNAFPSMALVYNNRGMFQQAQGRYGAAVLDFTKALELDPQFLVALTNRGFTLMTQGQFPEAENDF